MQVDSTGRKPRPTINAGHPACALRGQLLLSKVLFLCLPWRAGGGARRKQFMSHRNGPQGGLIPQELGGLQRVLSLI